MSEFNSQNIIKSTIFREIDSECNLINKIEKNV